ncbi:MAG: hypothetical protein KatS3mg118_2594 [Paracoccaceae bacterium]|nr:MAG: hypothetical protein KatS3mg118_2594 [Paracoccaceae bacterium]
MQFQFATARNWPFGAAVAVILLVFVMASLALYVRLTRKAGAGSHERPHAQPAEPARARSGAGRIAHFGWLGPLALASSFLYCPIVVLIAYSFNDSRFAMIWQGFSLKWYATVLENGDIRPPRSTRWSSPPRPRRSR